MAKATRATAALTQAGIDFAVHAYDYDPDVDRIGLAAAEALGVEPGRVLKTLMVLADGKPACVILPSDCEVAMKKLAAALGAKSAAMMPPAQAEKLSGYKVGGISPFGQMRRVPVAIEASAMDWRGCSSTPGSGDCRSSWRRGMRCGCWGRWWRG